MMHDFTGKCCGVHCVAHILVLIGGLNWGLVAVGGYLQKDLNVVHLLLGTWPNVEQIVYLLVGLSAVAMLFGSHCKACHK